MRITTAVRNPKQDDALIAQRAERLQETLTKLRGQIADQEAQEPNQAIVAPAPVIVEQFQRNTDRPETLDDIIGQSSVVLQLKVATAGAVIRQERMSHVLICGQSGFGKTSLAEAIATDLGVPMIATNGMMLKKPSDLTSLLMRVSGPTLLWVDEIHSAHRTVMETLFGVLEDSRLDLLQGSGDSVMAMSHALPDLIVVAATTRMGLLPEPFRNRFGLTLTMSDYSDEELGEIAGRFWKSKNIKFMKDENLQVARRSRGVPRNCMNLAKRVMGFAAVSESPNLITSGMVAKACAIFEVDENGLDQTDRKILFALTNDFAGRPIGLDQLGSHLGLESKTISDNHEGFLSRRGLLIRTGRGRMATPAAYELMKA